MKKYLKPSTEVIKCEMSSMIALSLISTEQADNSEVYTKEDKNNNWNDGSFWGE